MRNLTYLLLTGIILSTFIIVGCKNKPSSPPEFDEQSAHEENGYVLEDSGSMKTNIDAHDLPIVNTPSLPVENTKLIDTHNSIKRWKVQFNEDGEVISLIYGTDMFTLRRAMITSDEYPILISNSDLTGSSVKILRLTHKSDSRLIGKIQMVTDADVIREIRDFTNSNEQDPVLDSYAKIETSEEANFRISFYKALYSIQDQSSLPNHIRLGFNNRRSQAYMMVADTMVAEDRQVDININILPTNHFYLVNDPLSLSFQQPYKEVWKDSTESDNITALMEGLNVEGLDPLNMQVNKAVESQPITFTFNQALHTSRDADLQIEVTSNMEPLHFEISWSNTITRMWAKTSEVVLEDPNTQATLTVARALRRASVTAAVEGAKTAVKMAGAKAQAAKTASTAIALEAAKTALNLLPPILSFERDGLQVISSDNCDAIYIQESLTDKFRECTRAGTNTAEN